MKVLDFCFDKLSQSKSRGAVDGFEVLFERGTSLSIEVQEGKVDHLSRSTDQGLAFRVLKNKRMGFAYTFDFSDDAVEAAIRTAIDIADLMPEDPLLSSDSLLDFSKMKYPNVDAAKTLDRAGLERSMEEKIEMARSVERAARETDPRIKRVRKAGYEESIGETILMDSKGKRLTHEATVYSTDIMCVAEDGDAAETGSEYFASALSKDLKFTSIGQAGARNALELLHAGAAQTRMCPAVFKNSVVAELIGFLSSSFSAESIDKNFSLLIGKLGQKMFAKDLNLYDDGTLSGGLANSPFDGEGSPRQRTPLIEGGVVKNYIYDTYYAKKLGARSTGNCVRGLKSPPSIGTTNLYLEKGAHSFDALVGSAANGIYITDLMGLHTANPVTGEFSVGASGILIENGKLVKPVKGFAIAGNLVDLLSKVSGVGNDLRFWGTVGAPSLLISQISVGGA